MSLLHNAVKSSRLIRTVILPNQALLRPILSGPIRHFSTDAYAQQPPTQQTAEPFRRTDVSGVLYGTLPLYGRLSAITKNAITIHTLKSDIIRIMDESNLGPKDLKIQYDGWFDPVGVMIQFPSWDAYEAALKTINRRGATYKLVQVDHTLWDNAKFYDGKFLLLRGLPQTVVQDDIDRLLIDSEHDSSSINIFLTSDVKMAVVGFPNATLAMNAFITKNRSFCRNKQISMQVLH